MDNNQKFWLWFWFIIVGGIVTLVFTVTTMSIRKQQIYIDGGYTRELIGDYSIEWVLPTEDKEQ